MPRRQFLAASIGMFFLPRWSTAEHYLVHVMAVAEDHTVADVLRREEPYVSLAMSDDEVHDLYVARVGTHAVGLRNYFVHHNGGWPKDALLSTQAVRPGDVVSVGLHCA